MKTAIYETGDGSGAWVVECIDRTGDGECEKTIFYGANADIRAGYYLAAQNSLSVLIEPARRSA